MKKVVDGSIASFQCENFVEETLCCKKDYDVCQGRKCRDFKEILK